mmetsp:Transcript_21/g.61  ORF Transcript_21/g.61 Transcript_21/m.61 type:complete len:105 (+) Transcript_21:1591-1905(+)
MPPTPTLPELFPRLLMKDLRLSIFGLGAMGMGGTGDKWPWGLDEWGDQGVWDCCMRVRYAVSMSLPSNTRIVLSLDMLHNRGMDSSGSSSSGMLSAEQDFLSKR